MYPFPNPIEEKTLNSFWYFDCEILSLADFHASVTDFSPGKDNSGSREFSGKGEEERLIDRQK